MHRLLMAAACAALLGGCAHDVSAPALSAAPYCDVAKPIYWSSKDTRQTKEQADRENAKWKRLCQTSGKVNLLVENQSQEQH